MSKSEPVEASNFIRNIVDNDVASGKNGGQVVTRFPPEPNGYLHIGHAKSICLNFGIAKRYDGQCNLRFDDTNPGRESEEYANAIRDDVSWLGFEWNELRHASDYFDKLFEFAQELIRQDKAYVDSSSAEEVREMRGSLTEPGVPSPYRDRSVEENLDLFQRMKDGEFDDGEHILRAKIDMASGNINLRDPTLYRIRKVHHVRTGDKWSIYPMYDYTHCVSDALEGITHSLCTLEFEDHRPLYDWVLDVLKTPCHPQQIEFARLSLEYTMLSKRRLIQLVEENHVHGWDDPRMPTIVGMRRRGYTPESLRDFCDRIGITKNDAWIEMAVLETCIRDHLNKNAPRRMAVLDPIKITITDLPEDYEETLTFTNHPQDEAAGTRPVIFTREVFIDRDDFAEVPPPKYQRLIPGGEVRLRGSYVIKCEEIIKDADGKVLELRCTHDANTLGKKPEGRKVKGVVHWVSATHGVPAEVRLYNPLFNRPDPTKADTLAEAFNPESETILTSCVVEPALQQAEPEQHFQFERIGYFVSDRSDHRTDSPVFNRTVTLRDTWAK
ncbi:glutamine--tRNA ligase/YqeY domain fusion protein [Granulosicoccus antarcticus]|uniref:Glutamine--tRNA ligase n=1 Tax=Granulosicoccus antarcticus IMCC3135 TaxID=1192854 RepID=A0A2Z2P2D0_9GAMM|nr:glutamine--tRNA ligase/YqeY domain fusion protein [Granulosicoccus antarcticus]ASJ76458.1 Glutamine--tRNA ligase [Granulosicoccus antarcticus IMCC3135]